MDNLTHNTDVADDGVALLLSQFRAQGNVPDVLEALLGEVQELETAIVPALDDVYLAAATGWALEQIGELVGMPRPGYGDAQSDDDAYRVLVYGQIAANVSTGTLPELYNILRSLSLTGTRIFEVYPAAITVTYTWTELSLTYAFLRDILERATPPIELDITSHDETPFGLLGDDSAYGLGVGHIGAAE
jgi:hypothetical protein